MVPKYWHSAKTDESGYSPICANEWKKEVCQKGKVKDACKYCDNQVYVPLTDNLLRDHVTGKSRYGVYPLLDNNTCHFIAADFDDHEMMRDPAF